MLDMKSEQLKRDVEAKVRETVSLQDPAQSPTRD